MTNLRYSVAKRLIRRTPKSSAAKLLRAIGLKSAGYFPHDIKCLEENAAQTTDPVSGAGENQVAKPRRLGAEPEIHTHSLPPILPRILKNAKAHVHSSFLQCDQAGLLPQAAYDMLDSIRLDNTTFSIGFDHTKEIWLQRKADAKIDKGICVFGLGATNWYHWLIEILPLAMLAQNLPKAFADYPLLVPEIALSDNSFGQSLEIFRGNRDVIAMPRTEILEVSALIYIPAPVSGPFGMRDQHWPKPSDYVQNYDVMRTFRARILEHLEIKRDDNSPKRVFLARPPGHRSYNQDEILAAAQERGFEAVSLERHTFREQINLMYNADYVVGPTGAAFTNALFMTPGSRSLVWALKEVEGACFFSNLAHVAGSDMTYCFVDGDTDITSTQGAAFTIYTLPVEQFCQHLDTLLGEPAAAP